MSCISNTEIEKCDNAQFILSQSKCPACMYQGGGVNVKVSEGGNLAMLLSSGIFLTGVIACMICFRVVLSACAVRQDTISTADVQESIRRYGFKLTDTLPSAPIEHSVVPPAAAATGRPLSDTPSRHACSVCSRQLRLSKLEAHFTSQRRTPQVLSEPLYTAHGVNTEGDTDAILATEEPADDLIVFMLPCCHSVCYRCLGVQAQKATPSSSPQSDEPAAHRASPTLEVRIKEKLKGNCPACKRKIEEVLATERVLSL